MRLWTTLGGQGSEGYGKYNEVVTILNRPVGKYEKLFKTMFHPHEGSMIIMINFIGEYCSYCKTVGHTRMPVWEL